METEAWQITQPNQLRPDRRKHIRKGTVWRAQLTTRAGSFECRVRNLSPRGAMVQCDRPVSIAEAVTLSLEPSDEFLGVVAWRHDRLIGIRIREHRTPRTQTLLRA